MNTKLSGGASKTFQSRDRTLKLKSLGMGAFTREEWRRRRRREIMGKRRRRKGGNGIRKQVRAGIFHVKPEQWRGDWSVRGACGMSSA